ncbi:hypothetical protein D4764_14G0004860 [Takifugu flavidus]|uniref:CCHC-type domain-containing protein n=1 Tax=Takifugu flavidus TaxID=433684 RepID=A0A5C6P4F0_9TELE|nr:hypothetical protein D4764_14G0004860 [Takifugu flavidus]
MCGRHGGQGYGLIGGYLGRDQCHACKGYGHWQRDCPYCNYPECVLLRYVVVADPNAGQDTVVERSTGFIYREGEHTLTETVLLDRMGIGRQRPPVPVFLDRQGLGSPAQHARLTNVPRNTGDKAVLLDCRRLGGSVCPSKVHRRVPEPDAVPLDCRELGTPVSPQTAAVLLDRRGLRSPAQHARLTNVPRDTEGRGSPPRLQGSRSGPPGKPGIGAALQGNRNTGTGANTKEPKQAPTLDQQTHSQHKQTPRH